MTLTVRRCAALQGRRGGRATGTRMDGAARPLGLGWGRGRPSPGWMRGMQVCMPSTDTVKELAEEAAKPTLIFDKAMNKMEWQAMQVPALPGQQ